MILTEAIDNIIGRNSSKLLTSPHPNAAEMKIVYKAALRAPDHAWLRPSRFIEVKGKGLNRLSKIFKQYAKENIIDADDSIIKKYANAPFRAPMVIVAMTQVQQHPKVPEIEQILSTAAAVQNILLSLHALKYGSIWRTGALALNDKIVKSFKLNENYRIIGYIYVGTVEGKPKRIPSLDIKDFVTTWESDND